MKWGYITFFIESPFYQGQCDHIHIKPEAHFNDTHNKEDTTILHSEAEEESDSQHHRQKQCVKRGSIRCPVINELLNILTVYARGM